jgi:hypothetical protein
MKAEFQTGPILSPHGPPDKTPRAYPPPPTHKAGTRPKTSLARASATFPATPLSPCLSREPTRRRTAPRQTDGSSTPVIAFIVNTRETQRILWRQMSGPPRATSDDWIAYELDRQHIAVADNAYGALAVVRPGYVGSSCTDRWRRGVPRYLADSACGSHALVSAKRRHGPAALPTGSMRSPGRFGFRTKEGGASAGADARRRTETGTRLCCWIRLQGEAYCAGFGAVESSEFSWKEKRRLELLPGRLPANGEPPPDGVVTFVRTPVHRPYGLSVRPV